MVRAAQFMLAVAALWINAPAWAQSSTSPRKPPVRTWQQSSSAKKPAAKPPPKKPVLPKRPKVRVAEPAGVVIRSTDEKKPLGPAFNANANAQRDITEALIRAKSENRRVLILWGANWSDGCLRLNALLKTDPGLQRLMQYEYELVLVDVGARGRNLDIALSYGVAPQASGVPWLSVLNSDAEPICNLHADRFRDSRHEFDAEKFAEFLRGYQAMYPPADSLLNAALTDAQAGSRLLLLQFVAPTCERCEQLEQWFARSDVDAILSRNFVRLRIDVDRTIGGREVLRRFSKAWQTSIPWFALVNTKSGEVLVTSDGMDGQSVASLDTEKAVNRFGEILRTYATTITPQEVDWLKESLTELNAPPPAPPSPGKKGLTSAPVAKKADDADEEESDHSESEPTKPASPMDSDAKDR